MLILNNLNFDLNNKKYLFVKKNTINFNMEIRIPMSAIRNTNNYNLNFFYFFYNLLNKDRSENFNITWERVKRNKRIYFSFQMFLSNEFSISNFFSFMSIFMSILHKKKNKCVSINKNKSFFYFGIDYLNKRHSKIYPIRFVNVLPITVYFSKFKNVFFTKTIFRNIRQYIKKKYRYAI